MSIERPCEDHPSLAAAEEILKQEPSRKTTDLVQYWISIHPRTHLPGREHFDPLDIPKLLPYLVLSDVLPDPRRYRVRVMGTEVVKSFETDFTGQFFMDAIPDFHLAPGYNHRLEVEATGLPRYSAGRSEQQYREDFVSWERVHLPLATDGKTVDKVLSMTLYERLDPPFEW